MAYFPNGTSNEIYTASYCANCRNWRHDEATDTFGCPIMDLHMIWNYDAVGSNADETKAQALSAFIPMDGIEVQKCTMFLPWDEDRCDKTPDMFSARA